MRIINKYLLKELAGPFLGALIVSTFILAAGNIVQTIDLVVNKGVSALDVIKIFIYFLPYVLIFTIPISVLSAVLLGFGRLSGDNEITALRTSGIGFFHVIAPVLVSGIIVTLFNIPLNDKLLPQAEFNARKLIKSIGIKHPTALFEPGVFIKQFENYIVFVHSIKDNKLYNIHIYQPSTKGPTRSIIAERGEIVSISGGASVELKLENGSADEISPDNPDEYYKISFKEYHMRLDVDKTVDTRNIGKKTREKNIKELKLDIKEVRKNGGKDTVFLIEIHKKIALAASNFVFVLLGIPLAVTTHRREKFVGFGIAMGLFLLYWGIMLTGIAFSIRGILPPWLGVWSGNVILGCVALKLMRGIVNR
ncbi:putative permease YjgP/YjgQ [Candidatus Omnitrophus magneticus]|uniref:Putative permease YjgP/YjgQ n=1 Tax=Candidatus Omnitrophus magneticus TaxID=1609969 RepID=A0A0F0CPC0_9BACT|nr:putative permease YjgP/YjgQ [Candidatus Omnitrophus magneticus]